MKKEHDYVELYLKTLAIELRPTEVNETIREHLRVAWRNGWQADDLARAVNSGNYFNSTSPVGAAIYRLGKMALQPPPKRNTPQPLVPIRKVEKLPPEFRKARFELLQRALRGEFATEEEAAAAMQELIKQQEEEKPQ